MAIGVVFNVSCDYCGKHMPISRIGFWPQTKDEAFIMACNAGWSGTVFAPRCQDCAIPLKKESK